MEAPAKLTFTCTKSTMEAPAKLTFTCSESTVQTLEKGVKYLKS